MKIITQVVKWGSFSLIMQFVLVFFFVKGNYAEILFSESEILIINYIGANVFLYIQ